MQRCSRGCIEGERRREDFERRGRKGYAEDAKKPEINKELAIAVMPVYSCKGSAE
jgi:hypothetical protein